MKFPAYAIRVRVAVRVRRTLAIIAARAWNATAACGIVPRHSAVEQAGSILARHVGVSRHAGGTVGG